MLLGVPSVAPRTGGVPSVFEEKQDGLLFAPGNVDDLASHMDRVYNKKVEIEKMKNAATKSLTRFDAAQIADDVAGRIKKKPKHRIS